MDMPIETGPVRYWVFQHERQNYPLAKHLVPGKRESWKVLHNKEKVRSGDVVYFWSAGGGKTVLGWGVVVKDPVPDPYGDKSVLVEYGAKLSRPLTQVALKKDRWLGFLSPTGPDFAVTIEQALVLNRMMREGKQKAPADPGPLLQLETLLDGDLSATTRRIVEDAIGWTTGGDWRVPALTSSLLFFSFVRRGLESEREFLDTSRFLAQQATGVTNLLDEYLTKEAWTSDPELQEPLGDSLPAATLMAGLVMAAATRIALATTERPRVSLRHLLGALLEAEPLVGALGAHHQLKQAGIELPALRRDFVGYLRQYHSGEAIGEWEKVLLAPQDRINLLPSYEPDLPEGRDRLNIDAEVDALASLVASSQLEPPLSIGLFGDWGSGKSFFMRKMVDRVKWICNNTPPHPQPTGSRFYRNIVQIEFNAWHYSESKLWASLVTHIFDNLRLSLSGEKEDDVTKRRELVLQELDERKKLHEQASAELRDAEAYLAESEGALTEAENEAKNRSEDLRQLGVRDALGALSASPKIRSLFERAQNTLGLDAAGESARNIYEVVQEARSARGQADVLRQSMLHSEGWKQRVMWLGAALAFFVGLTLIVNLPWFETQDQTWEEIKNFVASFISLVGIVAGWLGAHMKRARESLECLREVDEEFSKQVEAERSRIQEELKQKTRELDDERTKVSDARRKREQAERAVEAKRNELRDLEPARRFSRFIQDRAASEDYRKELGILALIRKDFEKLADFLTSARSRKNEVLAIDRIILYIDDLDRCPADKVVTLLQAVHLLLAFRLFVVVVAVDARWIRKALVKGYENLLEDERPHAVGSEEHVKSEAATSEDYLEKIFQVPFWVKSMGDTGARSLAQHLLQEDLTAAQKASQRGERREGGPGRALSAVEAPSSGDVSRPKTVPHTETDTESSLVSVDLGAARDPAWILQPQRLELTKGELDVINQLAPLVGRSPRAVKRFINVYRILRAGLHREELSEFLGERQSTGQYPAALLLLAILNGSPALATELFRRLAAGDADQSFEAFVRQMKKDVQKNGKRGDKSELGRFFTLLEPFKKTWGKHLKVGTFQEWARRSGRYSFRMEMAAEVETNLSGDSAGSRA
jgi:hypothetical protein